MKTVHRVGLLVGRERSFPDALIARINGRAEGVHAEYATVDITHAGQDVAYDVLIDRISHEVPSYQPYLKHAALQGVRVINNPFWRIADDKFFGTALAERLGVAVPKTAVLPAKSYGHDITSGSLRNLRHPLDWHALVHRLGFPMYLKPHWGGGWKDVHCVRSLDELWSVYDRTGALTMIAQEGIQWTQYVRCVVIGRETVLPAPWDPRLSHFERYTGARETMPALSEAMVRRVTEDARKLCRALGYDMNTVEFGIKDDVPYAIDFMNSAPDFDISSLGEEQFLWVVDAMAELCIQQCHAPRSAPVSVHELFTP